MTYTITYTYNDIKLLTRAMVGCTMMILVLIARDSLNAMEVVENFSEVE